VPPCASIYESDQVHILKPLTDYVLIVMPEVERTQGKVIAYLVPTDVAVTEAKAEHSAWLKTNPNTKGDNRTWTKNRGQTERFLLFGRDDRKRSVCPHVSLSPCFPHVS